MDMNNPESMMKMAKKGKTVMMFVRVTEFVSKEDTETITSIWQTGLYNNHVQVLFLFSLRSRKVGDSLNF